MKDLWGYTDRDKGCDPDPPELCDYCGETIIDHEDLTDYRALSVEDNACADCLRSMAESHPHGKYLGL